ncbi:class II fructose-bisphosphate aldolase [Caproiciproducens galactitolivorans]|uniref:Class II fructose-bisphosphate aldolase n=1 Tax=Caproiciproducens galactitolivorans TaxID=642589 RepID=A0ABT4BZ36_9FIRM|nr:class II fructose-bisphosphate aldolase [Caproiciproducens galactitolivorans]MCY1715181.1 class II fructose-bisphosphate aldolase [Caproiciproducens galactitolivorans]
MSLVTSEKILMDAQRGNYAIGAFNAENMEMVQGIIEAAEELKSPVIIQTTPGTIKYGGLRYYYSNVYAGASAASVPVVLHLDHGSSFELASGAYREGYTSIMIDGSKLPFEENIALTRKVAEMCNPGNIPVEAELGRVGGKEDDLVSNDDIYTDPEKAAEFVKKTSISSLAVAIGTAHGFYAKTPVLDVNRLTEIRKVVDIPLVLHGASGLTDEQVMECIKRGICKVNFATELRDAFSKGVKKVIGENPDVFDPKVYCKEGKECVKELVKHKMLVCGSVNTAR